MIKRIFLEKFNSINKIDRRDLFTMILIEVISLVQKLNDNLLEKNCKFIC